MNAYAATYTAPLGDEILYFALERNTNTGNADVGFWFLQDEVGCESPGGTVDFRGAHTDGDLLVVSAFTGGGTVSTIDVYRWDGTTDPGALDPTPVADGVDCRVGCLPTIRPAARRTGSRSRPVAHRGQDHPGVGHTLPIAQFFEGGAEPDRGRTSAGSASHVHRRHPLLAS